MTTDPTESVDNRPTVIELDRTRNRIDVSGYDEAIEEVKERVSNPGAVLKIESSEGEIVFNSRDMDIEDWRNEFKKAKLRQGVEVEAYDCPYDSVGCMSDDLCPRCKLDKTRDRYVE